MLTKSNSGFYVVNYKENIFDFIIVGGPKNMTNRLNSLKVFDKNVNKDDFIIIFDDVNKQMGGVVDSIIDLLRNNNIEFDTAIIKKEKTIS